MQHIYLTRRNLLTLLAKLDRAATGDATFLTLLKRDTQHPTFPCTEATMVTAIEDHDYYTDREPGRVHPREEEAIALNTYADAIAAHIYKGNSDRIDSALDTIMRAAHCKRLDS